MNMPRNLLAVLWISLAMAAARSGAAEPKPQIEPQLAVFFEKNCIACHGPKKSKGDLRLDQITADFSQRENFERWHEIATRIASGEMPPKKEPQPDPAQAAAVVRHITARLDEAAAKRRATEGRVVLRRLNRVGIRKHRARPAGRGCEAEGLAAARYRRRAASTTSATRCTPRRS